MTTTTEAIEASVGGGVVFVPADAARAGDTQVRLQLRRMEDGRMVALAYSTLELLVAGCGPDQAWIAAPVEELENLKPLAGFDVIALDVELPPDWRVETHDDTDNTGGK